MLGYASARHDVSMGAVLLGLELFCSLTAPCCLRSRARPERGMWPNAWVAAVAFAWAMPLLAGVAVVAWLGALLPAARLEASRAGLVALFFAAYLAEDAERCGPPPGRTCAALS